MLPGVFPAPVTFMAVSMEITRAIMQVIIPASTSSPAMTDLRFMIFMLTTISTMKQMDGTMQTVQTTTEAGTAAQRVRQTIPRF